MYIKDRFENKNAFEVEKTHYMYLCPNFSEDSNPSNKVTNKVFVQFSEEHDLKGTARVRFSSFVMNNYDLTKINNNNNKLIIQDLTTATNYNIIMVNGNYTINSFALMLQNAITAQAIAITVSVIGQRLAFKAVAVLHDYNLVFTTISQRRIFGVSSKSNIVYIPISGVNVLLPYPVDMAPIQTIYVNVSKSLGSSLF